MNELESAPVKNKFDQQGKSWNSPGIALRTGLFVLVIFVWTIVVTGYALPALAGTGNSHVGLQLMDAVEATLSRQPGINLEKQLVRMNAGILQEEHGLFDPRIELSGGQSRTDLPLPGGSTNSSGTVIATPHETTDTSTLEISVYKTLRNGLILKPSVSISRTEDSWLYTSIQNFATVSFNLTVPLLRGRGEVATAGREMAARKAYDAGLLQFRNTAARLVQETVMSYWSYVAAIVRLEELKKSESRAEEFVNMVKTLVQSDERPGADLQQVVASFETKAALRAAGGQALQEVRQQLGMNMGLSLEEIDSMPLPTDSLPPVPDRVDIDLDLAPLAKQALTMRNDYLAYKMTVEASLLRLEAEKTSLLPILDFELSAGYSGLDEGSGLGRFANSLRNRVPGANVSALLTYKWPVGNNTAHGKILQKDAEHTKDKILLEDFTRKIGSSIAIALFTVKNAITEVGHMRKSVLMYETALKNERKKTLSGSSTFLDLIVIEDRLQEAIQSNVSARLRYAEALTRLRFETGLLLAGEGEQAFVRMEDLITLPQNTREGNRP